jgi:hypothetical protein
VKIARTPGADTYDLEHRVLSEVQHPGLARSIGVGETEEAKPVRALVLELAPGRQLGDPYNIWTPRPVRRSVRIAMQILRVVRAMEAAGWRQNDLQPANVQIR